MIKQDRQKLSILVILLAVLGLTLLLGYRMNQPQTTAAVQSAAETKTSANPPTASDARIRLDLVEKPEAANEAIGRRNVFQYYQAPPPVPQPPVGARPGVGPGGRPPTAAATEPVPFRPPAPPQPPPPPPIPLKFQGFAATAGPGGGFIAFLVDDTRPADVKHFNVSIGEVLMGRYRIAGISDKSVDVEDLQYNQRKTLPLLK
jgi:hypothetical protein